MINRDIERFGQDKLFEGKNVHDQAGFSIKQYLTFFHKFILSRNITCNDKDRPWLHGEVGQTIIAKNVICR